MANPLVTRHTSPITAPCSLTFARGRDYAFFMRLHRETYARGLSAALMGVALASLPSGGLAAEFYSWIDSSGTMVMTDDLSRVPPAIQRSAVSVHRFLDRQSEPPFSRVQSESNENGEVSLQARLSQKTGGDQTQPLPADPALLDLPKILLVTPDERAQAEYVWVPLLSPLYLGASPVPGFWCLRSVTDPGVALNAYVNQHRGQVMVGGSPWRYGPVGILPDNAGPVWGHLYGRGTQTHNQVMRMQQMLSGRIVLHGQPAPASGPAAAGNGQTSGRR
jgi:hypothetical protein